MSAPRTSSRLLLWAAASLTAVSLVGCVQNAPTTAAPTGEAIAVTADDAVAALVPAAISESGALRVGVNLTYSPNEFKTPEGEPTGWAIEL
ncbi:MAG TPA: ABC transporter substrate-binding protein, partial [Microterricola sp.]